MGDPTRRESDRYVTPMVVVWAMVLGTFILLGIVAAVTFLTWQGFDPAPVVELVANLVAAIGAMGTLGLQLVNGARTAKVERNTRGGYVPPADAPPPTDRLGRRSALPPVPGRGTAPAAGGS